MIRPTIHSRNSVGVLAAAIALLSANPVVAQSLAPVQIPLGDTDCNNGFGSIVLADCTYVGTRTHTSPVVSSAPVPGQPGMTTVTHSEDVTFDGTIQAAGIPVPLNGMPPFFFPADLVFPSSQGLVDASLSYTGLLNFNVSDADVPAYEAFLQNPLGQFNGYDIHSLTVHSIGVNIKNQPVTDLSTGQEYSYSLASVDPTAITNNGVALSGKYRSSGNNGAIIFGKLGGTATLAAAPTGSTMLTPSPLFLNPDGTPSYGWISPLALQYAVTAQEITRLDENGLITPTVAVTQGIEMNGSRVTGLGAGVAPTDAVNLAQLQAESTARTVADTALGTALVNESSARVTADNALGSALVTESTSRQTVDNALGNALLDESRARMAGDLAVSNQLNALDSRVSTLQGRVDRLDKKIESSTALAIAMGGATFLPGMKFNLTANVST